MDSDTRVRTFLAVRHLLSAVKAATSVGAVAMCAADAASARVAKRDAGSSVTPAMTSSLQRLTLQTPGARGVTLAPTADEFTELDEVQNGKSEFFV